MTGISVKPGELTPDVAQSHAGDDLCGFCGQPGADKIPHPVRWPGEDSAGTPYVHATCEADECRMAYGALTDQQREEFLRWV